MISLWINLKEGLPNLVLSVDREVLLDVVFDGGEMILIVICYFGEIGEF